MSFAIESKERNHAGIYLCKAASAGIVESAGTSIHCLLWYPSFRDAGLHGRLPRCHVQHCVITKCGVTCCVIIKYGNYFLRNYKIRKLLGA
jgi:hypothetical protein